MLLRRTFWKNHRYNNCQMRWNSVHKHKLCDLEDYGYTILRSRVDSKLLLMNAMELNRESYLRYTTSKNISVYQPTNDQVNRYYSMVQRRKSKEPIQYILGQVEFWSMNFKVNTHTLIPRSSSEVIVEQSLNHISNNDKILDLGTGTGCLLLSILSENTTCTGVGVDISPNALNVARQNASNLNIIDRVKFIESNWLKNVQAEKYNVIVSNPPYISKVDYDNLPVDIKDNEPHSALYGGFTGLEAYQNILNGGVCDYLKPGGYLILEIGYDQRIAVTEMYESEHLKCVNQLQDDEGIDRCLVFKYQ
eukprot:TRINITY_DN979_c3_g1_i1.p1 TRINITY_DN979_c3_g1~~TRINITY_DN979_c3_g1_i1.p1  ORF type:complete len:306 (+),score=44.79 TRINITY_DN979_c3_g1_i1:2-919(+)